MSNVKKIDFSTAHDAEEKLKQLIAANPNPLREIDSMEYLDELTRDDHNMSKPGKQRMAEYRQRLKADGIRGMYIFIHDNDRQRLEKLAASLDMTIGECVAYLLDSQCQEERHEPI